MSDLSEEVRREIEDIRTRTGRANPVIDGSTRVLEQVGFDRARLDQIIETMSRPAAGR